MLEIRRREFIAGLGGAAAWPLAARAQQGNRVRRVGVLMNAAATEVEYQGYLTAFVQEMRRLGWSEGQNLRLDVHWNAGDAVLSHTYAAELIRLMPDVIVAASSVNLAAVEQRKPYRSCSFLSMIRLRKGSYRTYGSRAEMSRASFRTNFHLAVSGSIC
jgi:hypothetical protein